MGKLFISYRRDDTQDITGRLFERLAARFGATNIFMDVDSVPLGSDFRQILRDAVAESSVALVMIGRQWLSVTDERGQRRLDNPNDFVRIEVEAALGRKIPVVPILTQGVAMPRERDLPPSMTELAFRHGVDVRSDQHFGPDAEQLIVRLAPLLNPQSPQIASQSVRASQPVVAPPPPAIPTARFPARLASLGYQAHAGDGVEWITPPLVSVAAGRFLMGSDPARDEVARTNDWAKREMPQDWVEVAEFQLGKYPVTVAEYALAVNAGAVGQPPTAKAFEYVGRKYPEVSWQTQLKRLDHPVVCVSWQDASAYITWLRTVTRQPGWRLPSEAQWEKAARWDARANASRIYPWGDGFDNNRCNTRESGIGATTPVGSYPADNPQCSGASLWGAEDMTGNVWEWTSSLYKPYKYSESDGREDQNSTGNRTLRGGSWGGGARGARAAYRLRIRPDGFNGDFGFRLALPAAAGS